MILKDLCCVKTWIAKFNIHTDSFPISTSIGNAVEILHLLRENHAEKEHTLTIKSDYPFQNKILLSSVFIIP